MAHVVVQMHLNERATGHPARNWLTSWAHRYFRGNRLRVLVLGCGEGWLERGIAEWPFVADIDAVDFAADAVQRARTQTEAMGISKIWYDVVDLNHADLGAAKYDVVVAHAVIHHVENLEHAAQAIERALKPDGFLVLNEYVGPSRFQYSDDVDRAINALLHVLPPRLRRSTLHGDLYDRRARPTVDQMIASDPSESVRSSELLARFGKRFDFMERRNIGGTILQHLLYDIVANFQFEDVRDRSILELLCATDAMLVDTGVVPCDFVIAAARKRGSSVVAERRPLPLLPPEALQCDPDPLRLAGFQLDRRYVGSRGPREWSEANWPGAMKMLRISWAAQRSHRRFLFFESRRRTMLERAAAAATHSSPMSWVLARAPGDSDLRTVLEVAATLAGS